MSRVEEINTLGDLARCRLLWDALGPQTPRATFFHTLDWLEVYWRHYGGGQKLRALIVSAAGKPIGILPLVVQTERSGLGPIRILTYPLHGWGTVYGPIGPHPTATLLAALGHVRRTRRDWDLLDLRWVDKTGSDRGRTRRAMELAGWRPREQAWARTAVVETSGNWDAYWKSRTEKWRKSVRRLHRRLAERGELKHIRYRPEGEARGDGDPRWDWYDACVRLSRKSGQRSSDRGTELSHPPVAPYLRETHAVAARRGALDLNLLLLDGAPAAFVYNYHYRGSVDAVCVGFDPRLRAFGPAVVLQQMVLEDSFRRDDRFYDLGVGSLDTKRNWQTSTVTSYRYTHFPATAPRAQLLRVKRWFQDRFSNVDDLVLARSA